MNQSPKRYQLVSPQQVQGRRFPCVVSQRSRSVIKVMPCLVIVMAFGTTSGDSDDKEIDTQIIYIWLLVIFSRWAPTETWIPQYKQAGLVRNPRRMDV